MRTIGPHEVLVLHQPAGSDLPPSIVEIHPEERGFRMISMADRKQHLSPTREQAIRECYASWLRGPA